MERARVLGLSVCIITTLALRPALAPAGYLLPLGNLPGRTTTYGLDISRDGSVIVGTSGGHAFRWTQPGGMVDLGFSPLTLNAVSGDGLTIVGQVNSSNGKEAFRWTQAGGMVLLGDIPGGSFESEAYGVNQDGSVVVGRGSASNSVAFRWTQSGGMVSLGILPKGLSSWAYGVSGDGSIVVGPTLAAGAFKWTQATGLTSLPVPPGGSLGSTAYAMSDDGQTIVGTSAQRACRWTQGGSVGQMLGVLPLGDSSNFATDVSDDGSVIAGEANTSVNFPSTYQAIRWTEESGMQRLWDTLVASGVDPAASGWSVLTEASGVSGDGTLFSGWGTRNGKTEAFLAMVERSVLPEPPSLTLIGIGIFTSLKRLPAKRGNTSTSV